MFELSKDWSQLPSLWSALAERGSTDMDGLPRLEVQPRWEVPDTVVITAAASGEDTA